MSALYPQNHLPASKQVFENYLFVSQVHREQKQVKRAAAITLSSYHKKIKKKCNKLPHLTYKTWSAPYNKCQMLKEQFTQKCNACNFFISGSQKHCSDSSFPYKKVDGCQGPNISKLYLKKFIQLLQKNSKISHFWTFKQCGWTYTWVLMEIVNSSFFFCGNESSMIIMNNSQ